MNRTNRTVRRYLERRTALDDWPLQGAVPTTCRSIIVIPVLAEFPGILDTLGDLAKCDGEDRAQTLVIAVVNNRAPEHAVEQDIAQNEQTLRALDGWDQDSLPVAWIDASSPGRELSVKDGVGMARKIGLDQGLRILAEQDRLTAPLVSLDGDSRVDARYLSVLHRFFEPPASRWACVLPYAHPVEGSDAERAAILSYELYLRYHALHLAWSGSPYAHHTIGSTMACTAEAYATVIGRSPTATYIDFNGTRLMAVLAAFRSMIVSQVWAWRACAVRLVLLLLFIIPRRRMILIGNLSMQLPGRLIRRFMSSIRME